MVADSSSKRAATSSMVQGGGPSQAASSSGTGARRCGARTPRSDEVQAVVGLVDDHEDVLLAPAPFLIDGFESVARASYGRPRGATVGRVCIFISRLLRLDAHCRMASASASLSSTGTVTALADRRDHLVLAGVAFCRSRAS